MFFFLTTFCAVNAGQLYVAFSEEPNRLSLSWVEDRAFLGILPPRDASVLFDDHIRLYAHTTLPGNNRWFHHAMTPELVPGRTYHVQHNGEVYHVQAPDTETAARRGFSAMWVADMGVANSAGVRNQMKKFLPGVDFVIHGGDIAYADDRDFVGSNPKYNTIWDQWGEEMSSITSAKPYMVAPGNHDDTCHSYGGELCPPNTSNFTYFRNRFRMPQNSDAGNMWYSYDYGNVHFVSINTETDFPGAPASTAQGIYPYPRAGPFGDQLAWLDNDLANNKQPWTIVYGHRYLYSSIYGSPFMKDYPPSAHTTIRDAFEPILLKHNVDLYICGHKHGYERIKPTRDGKVDTRGGLVSIVNGAAGSIEGHDSKIHRNHLTAYANGKDWGLSLLHWINPKTLEVTFVSETGKELDKVTLTKH